MRYCDLQPAFEAYKRGENVTQLLRERLGSSENTPEIIEIAYDLQAGTYAKQVEADEHTWRGYTGEMAKVLTPLVDGATSILEAGTGEMTTLVGVANACYGDDVAAYACDLSWSRLHKGQHFVEQRLNRRLARALQPFVADFLHLPFLDASIDVVWTSHAVEPNGGREREVLRELLRVARKSLILFEPSYENNSVEGRARMDSLGYVRGLAEAAALEGGIVENRIMLNTIVNPLNPTEAFVIRPPARQADDGIWACPATSLPMVRRADCFWCERSMLAYPILSGIPVLRPEAAVLASAMSA